MTDKTLADKAIDIKWKSYVQVKDRIQYLSDNYDGRYSMESDYDYYPERKLWVVKAKLTIWDEKHEHCCVYTWLAQEIESDDYRKVNFSSSLENAESSARGRACASFGLGIQCEWGIASADEVVKAINRGSAFEWPFTDKKETPKEAKWDWYEKTLSNTKFMTECLDELDFMKKIKARVTEIWEKMTDEQEKNLRIAYNNAIAMKDLDLPIE